MADKTTGECIKDHFTKDGELIRAGDFREYDPEGPTAKFYQAKERKAGRPKKTGEPE